MKPELKPETGNADGLQNADLIGAALNGPSTSVLTYSFDSLLPRIDEAALQAAPADYPAWVSKRYLQLPDSVPERVRGLARDLTAHARTPLERALAIQSYVRKIPYSLEVPAPPHNWDAADYFLFHLKKGYCDYYATAMAVLARAAGLPARLVLGYASGSYDPNSAQYIVTQADAHSWTEIYFTGIGWVEFEPTANQPAFLEEQLGTQAAYAHPKATNGSANPLSGVLGISFRVAWWLLAAMPLSYLIWIGIDGWQLGHMNPDEALQRVYMRLRRQTHRVNGIPPMGQTAREFAAALEARISMLSNANPMIRWLAVPLSDKVSALTDLYMRSLFASVALSDKDSRRAIRVWLAVRWRLGLMNLALTLCYPRFRIADVPSNAAHAKVS